jgi:hypothetical protein
VRNNCELVEYGGGDNEIVNLKGISSNSFFSFLNTHTFEWGRERHLKKEYDYINVQVCLYTNNDRFKFSAAKIKSAAAFRVCGS